MTSLRRTPNFDTALEEYFQKLELDSKGGQWRTCRLSGERFYIRAEDMDFYRRMRVPLPTLSPRERIRQKLAFLNSYNLFWVTSAFSRKEIIAQFPPGTPYKIYEHQVWFGEQWDPTEYGVPYDPQKKFFKQYQFLQRSVPRPNLYVDTTSANSDYTNNSSRLKGCYLVFDSYQAEDSAYSIGLIDSRSCYDSFTLYNSDTGYDGFESFNLYRCFFVEYSRNCLDSWFLFDCRDCEHCFGCTNLRHKKYYFFNEPLTSEEYQRRVNALNLGDRRVLNEVKARFAGLKQRAIYKQNHNERTVVSFGDYLRDCKNCYSCFYEIGCENLAYSIGGLKVHDSYDILGGVGSEFCYEGMPGEHSYGVKFSSSTDFSRNLEYCELCTNCHDCFGCIGLKNRSFCIFNKQYTEAEYWGTVDRIKTVMLRSGEYGEFFPPALTPIPYNLSLATSYKGYDDVEVARRYGYRIQEIPENFYNVEGEIVDSQFLPTDIAEVEDGILEKIIYDSKNYKKFRYIRAELDFYRKHHLPLPTEHYTIRLAEKRKRFGSIALELYDRVCPKCGKTMQSSYALDRPEIVYCEQCYQAEVA